MTTAVPRVHIRSEPPAAADKLQGASHILEKHWMMHEDQNVLWVSCAGRFHDLAEPLQLLLLKSLSFRRVAKQVAVEHHSEDAADPERVVVVAKVASARQMMRSVLSSIYKQPKHNPVHPLCWLSQPFKAISNNIVTSGVTGTRMLNQAVLAQTWWPWPSYL